MTTIAPTKQKTSFWERLQGRPENHMSTLPGWRAVGSVLFLAIFLTVMGWALPAGSTAWLCSCRIKSPAAYRPGFVPGEAGGRR